MSFFEQFPKLKYDTNQDGIQNNLTDIFRYVDVIEGAVDNLYAYSYTEVADGERPDQLSQRLYGTPDYYWSFFITNDRLKNGLTDWPKSSNELDNYINYIYGSEFGVIGTPDSRLQGSSTDDLSLLGSYELLNNTKYKDKLYVFAGNAADTQSTAIMKLIEFDEERYQVWVDKTKQYYPPTLPSHPFDFGTNYRPSNDIAEDNLRIWYKLDSDHDWDASDVTASNSSGVYVASDFDKIKVPDAASHVDQGGAQDAWAGGIPGVVGGTNANLPTWDSDERAYYFNQRPQLNFITLNAEYYAENEHGREEVYNYVYDNGGEFRSSTGGFAEYSLFDYQDWTIFFCLKTDMGSGSTDDSEAENGCIVGSNWPDRGSTSTPDARGSGMGIVDGKLSVWMVPNDDDSTIFTPDELEIRAQSKNVINDNAWHVCMLTNTGSTKIMRLYVDGVLQDKFNGSQEFLRTVTDLGPYIRTYEKRYYFPLANLMMGAVPYDSDSDTSDDPGNDAAWVGTGNFNFNGVTGYLKDFRVFNSVLSGNVAGRTSPYSAFIIDDSDLNTAYEDEFFAWDKQANHFKEISIGYGADSDNDPNISAWDSDARAFNLGRTDLRQGGAINRLYIRGYDYWKDSALAPNYYTNRNIAENIYYDSDYGSDTGIDPDYWLDFPAYTTTSRTQSGREDILLDTGSESPARGYVYYLQGKVLDEDSDIEVDWTPLQNNPYLKADSPYYGPFIGDGNPKQISYAPQDFELLTGHTLQVGTIIAKPIISTDNPLEILVDRITSDSNYYYVHAKDLLAGYHHVLYYNTSTSSGDLYSGDGWKELSNIAHIIGTGDQDEPTKFVVDKDWYAIHPSVTPTVYWKIYAFQENIRDEDDPNYIETKAVTAYDALVASGDNLKITEKDGWLKYRNPDYITNKQLEVDRNTENSFIKTVKTGYIGDFGDNFRALINR
tara:strand:+ start:3113 stop:5941 length:2829 start_codon:yes stop_codon:yes gene_type:complete